MALIIPPGFAQIALRFTLTGDPEVMVTTFGVDTDGDPAAVVDLIAGNIAGSVSSGDVLSGWSWIGVVAYVGQDGGPPSVVENTDSIVGAGSTSGLPTNCAWLVRKNTALGGRQGRGRCFVPPFVGVEGDVDMNGILTSGQQAGLQAMWDDFVAGVDAVLLHDSTSPAEAPTPITQWVVDRQIATQRRRMRS